MFDYQILEHEDTLSEEVPINGIGLWAEDRCGVIVMTDGTNVASMHTYANRGTIDASTGEYDISSINIYRNAFFDNTAIVAFDPECHDFFAKLVYVNGVLVQDGFDYSYNTMTHVFEFDEDYKGANVMIVFS